MDYKIDEKLEKKFMGEGDVKLEKIDNSSVIRENKKVFQNIYSFLGGK